MATIIQLATKVKLFSHSKKLWILAVLIVGLVGVGSYQTYQFYLIKKGLGKVQPASSSWQTLQDEDGKFSLSFPGKSEELKETIKIEQTDVDTLSYRSLLDNGTIYSLYFVSYPETVDLTDFDKNAKRMLKAVTTARKGTQLVSGQKGTIENKPSLDLTFTNQEGSTFNYRFVLVDRDFYILSTAALQGETAENEKFFSSLELFTKGRE